MNRPGKFIRLNFAKQDPEVFLALLGDPAEARLSVSKENFISIKEGVISISPGLPGKINIQGLPGTLKYGGMISELPFPLAMLPKTPLTPLPTHIIQPPLLELLPTIRGIVATTASFVVPV